MAKVKSFRICTTVKKVNKTPNMAFMSNVEQKSSTSAKFYFAFKTGMNTL